MRETSMMRFVLFGAVGFGVGYWLGHFLRAAITILSQIREAGSVTIAGALFGASMGAALAFLERSNLASEHRPRVR